MVRRLIWLGIAAGLLFLAWPFWSGWQLRQAMRTRDTASLETRVDWPTLRANLKPKFAEAVRADASRSGAVVGAVKRALGGVLADKGIDVIVTPGNLARILAGREFVTRRTSGGSAPPPPETDAEDPDDPLPPRRLRWAFFESPSRFRIEAIHPRVPNGRVVAILGFTGYGWKLIDLDIVAR
jgi:hypothetical protein